MDDIRLQLSHLLLSSDYLLGGKSSFESDNSYIEQLTPIVRSAIQTSSTEDLLDALQELEQAREADTRAISEDQDNPFLYALDELHQINATSNSVARDVQSASAEIKAKGSKLLTEAQRQANMTRTRQNIESSMEATKVCLQAFEYTNQVFQLLKTKNKIAAVQSLYELQNMNTDKLRSYGLTTFVQKTVPALSRAIMKATLEEVDEFIDRLDSQIPKIGNRAYELLSKQREAWETHVSEHPHLQPFRFNSSVELAYRESSINYMTDTQLDLDFGPMFEAGLVFTKLDKMSQLADHVDQKRHARALALVPEGAEITAAVLENVAGFCVTERTMSWQLPRVRSDKLVDDVWEQIIRRLTKALSQKMPELKQTSEHVPFKDMLAKFIETLENFDFNVSNIMMLLRDLVKYFSDHLVEKSREKFLHSWRKEDHMPLVVNKPELYDTILGVVWYNAPESEKAKGFPRVLPFSEIYPLTCADLRSLITHHTSFFDLFQKEPVIVEDMLSGAIESFLTDTVCKTFMDGLKGSKREQIVQTLIDLEYFELATVKVQAMLESIRISSRRSRPLKSLAAFANARRYAERRVFQLVEDAIDNFIEVARVDWRATKSEPGPAAYALEMTAYLLTMTNSTLARLPTDIRTMTYLAAGDHLRKKLMGMLDAAPDGITAAALQNFDKDLTFLEDFISGLSKAEENPSLVESLTEVRQTLNLLRSEDPTEYNRAELRMKKYDRIDSNKISALLAKLQAPGSPNPSIRTQQSGFMRYLHGERQ